MGTIGFSKTVWWTSLNSKSNSGIASNSTLVNDARIRNDILQAASKHTDTGLIENMMFERTSGEKVTGSQLSLHKNVFVVSETNVGDMQVGDTFDKLGEGVSIRGPDRPQETLGKDHWNGQKIRTLATRS